jgi:type IV pilus assembly protein PilV
MRPLADTAGFTLIEILIATVILTIGALGIATLTAGVMQGNATTKQLTIATTLAKDRLETIKRLGYAAADTAIGTEAYGTLASAPGHQRVTTMAPNTPAADMTTATATVSWAQGAHAVSLQTILAR